MKASRHTITGKLSGSDKWFAINLLSGNADMTDEAHVRMIQSGTPDPQLVAKGYVVDPEQEERVYRAAYLDFLDNREKEEIQIFYAPWYSCNFACDYCYQAAGSYQSTGCITQQEVMQAFFSYVDKTFANRKKYLTLFGGEPLLPGEYARKTVRFFLEQASLRGLDVAIVTNGYTLAEYVAELSSARIREVQVTLDGLADIHDIRRPLQGGGKTFDRVVAGIDAALQAGIPINLRVVIDRDNMGHLHELSRFAITRGWTANPIFKTQLGRSYELHACMKKRDRLYTRLSMYQNLFEEIQAHPEILEFHRPAYSVSRFLFDHEELPDPLFDSCPGTKTEWAFDSGGKIYTCTATVGKAGEELGTFYPEARLDSKAVAGWQNRDVAAIKECRGCPVALACGGGCAAVAKNRTGKIQSPDCRPVRELLELGLSLYLKEQDATG